MKKAEKIAIYNLIESIYEKLPSATPEQRLQARNKAIDKVFEHISKLYPQWRFEALHEGVAKFFVPLSANTIRDVVTGYYDTRRNRASGKETDPNQLDIFNIIDGSDSPQSATPTS